jgi:hypothetical protein
VATRPAGVRWIPVDQFNRVVAELQTNPCAAERFPFESMERACATRCDRRRARAIYTQAMACIELPQ